MDPNERMTRAEYAATLEAVEGYEPGWAALSEIHNAGEEVNALG